MDQARTTAAPEVGLHFLDYWRIIRIRKAIIILVFLLVSVTATFVTFILTKYYSSRARIEVHVDTTDIASMTQQSMSLVDDPYFIQTEFEVIRSQTILDRVVNKLKLNELWTERFQRPYQLKTPETRDMLKGMIDLSAERNTSLIDITVYDTDANEAALLANTVAEVYQDYRQEEWAANLTRGIRSLNKETTNYDEDVRQREAELSKMRKVLKINEMDPNAPGPSPTLSPSTMMQLNGEVLNNKSRVAQLETKLAKLKALSLEDQRQAMPTVANDNILPGLLQDLNAAQSKLRSTHQQSWTAHGRYRADQEPD